MHAINKGIKAFQQQNNFYIEKEAFENSREERIKWACGCRVKMISDYIEIYSYYCSFGENGCVFRDKSNSMALPKKEWNIVSFLTTLLLITMSDVQMSYIPLCHQIKLSQLVPAIPCSQWQIIAIPFVSF